MGVCSHMAVLKRECISQVIILLKETHTHTAIDATKPSRTIANIIGRKVMTEPLVATPRRCGKTPRILYTKVA